MGRQLMIISQIQDRQLLLMPKNHRNRTIFKLEGQETHYFKQIAGDNSWLMPTTLIDGSYAKMAPDGSCFLMVCLTSVSVGRRWDSD